MGLTGRTRPRRLATPAGPGRPSLAVVIPAWDSYVGPDLVRAVDSVVDQAAARQVIVVDNASTKALPGFGDSVAVVRCPTRVSTGAARNLGLAAVETPLVVFLDADDLALPGSIDALVDGLAARPELVAYGLGIVDGRTGARHRTPRRAARLLAGWPTVFAVLNSVWSLLPTQGATVMRTDQVRAAGGYGDANHGEDWALGASLAFRGPIGFGSRPALVYRVRPDSPGTARSSRGPLLENARAIRLRLAGDPAVPAWVRRGLPVIAGLQWSAARLVHPAVARIREVIRGSREATRRRPQR